MARAATSTKTENTEELTRDLEAEIAALRDDISAITSTLGDLVKHGADEAKTEAKRLGKRVEKKGEEAIEAVQERYESAESELRDVIREKPIASVLLAAGVGYIISKIL